MNTLTAWKLPSPAAPKTASPTSPNTAVPLPPAAPSRRPIDWPGAGPIDLRVQDLPHASATTEWWYLNTHVTTADGRQLSIFAAFFRIIHGQDAVTKQPEYAHSLTWAITDSANGVYTTASRVDQHAARMGLERIRRGHGSKDARLNRAMRETLERDEIPLPDRRFDGEVAVALDRLELDFGDALLTKTADGTYQLSLRDDDRQIACTLSFKPRKGAVRHGDDGVVRAAQGETMFYYFVPRCQVQGTVTTPGFPETAAEGSGWYDHEFGAPEEAPAPATEAVDGPKSGSPLGAEAGSPLGAEAGSPLGAEPGSPLGAEPGSPFGAVAGEAGATDADIAVAGAQAMAWTWIAAQLNDGRELTVYRMVRADNNEVVAERAVLVAKDGTARSVAELELAVVSSWRSVRSFQTYPTRLTLDVPAFDLHLTVEASFADQEFLTVISKPAFWEGRCELQGRIGLQPVKGTAYLERSGYEMVETLDQFFGEVGAEVRASVAAALPSHPTFAEALDLIGNAARPQYMDGVDVEQLSRTLFQPIREISDRGGKSWRSYAALACCDVVQGDSRKFARWLAMPELMHVGSLIVDDVQDKSKVRRGGPACHVVHGEALAINAGTAAYFLLHELLMSADLPDDRKLKVYSFYFEALRAGHAGQALDLDGLGDLMPSVVASGDGALLESRVRACHRLKTGAPAGALARMGAVAGGGSDDQVEALGAFFESLGLAFQILDDVLNLRGFKGDLKSRGEDIVNGTITLPVAKAMGRLDRQQREWLWTILQSEGTEPMFVTRAVQLLEQCGALQACVQEAETMVEEAWARAAPLFKPSLTKVMLRAFGWYILDRHY